MIFRFHVKLPGCNSSIFLVKFHRDLTRPIGPQNVAVWKATPLISGKSRLVKYCNLARFLDSGVPISKKTLKHATMASCDFGELDSKNIISN